MKSGNKTRRALTLSLVGGLAAFPAAAQGPVSGTLLDGIFEIETTLGNSNGTLIPYGCMILGDQGRSTIPSLYKWDGDGHFCNLDESNPQAQWKIYPIVANGLVRHVIRNMKTDGCLIRGGVFADATASTYLWPDSADKHLCGFKTATEFVANGQAAWDLSQVKAYSVADYGYATGDIMYSGSISLLFPTKPRAYLMFSPTPASSPSSVPDVSLATFSELPTQWVLYFYPSTMVPISVSRR